MTTDSPPPVRVTLPDGEVRGVLHERRQWERGGWMYLVGIKVWTNTEDERVEAREYRMWLTPDKEVHPIPGVDYKQVPKVPLTDVVSSQDEQSGGLDPKRWTWKVERIRGHGRPGALVIHEWNCAEAPVDEPEIDVQAALDTMTTTPGATLCQECDASVVLTPLLDPDYRAH